MQAAGKDLLRSGLPVSLLAVLEGGGGPLTGIELAEAAIATYHTSALKEFRSALTHLAPPAYWAGSPYAVAFVTSLGFSEEWAGQRNPRRPPFVEVEGPVLASSAPRVPETDRRQGARDVMQRPFSRHPASGDDQSADRFREDARCGTSHRRVLLSRLQWRRALGGRP